MIRDSICSTEDGIKCDDCDDFFHLNCSGSSTESNEIHKDCLKLLGWTCHACKLDLRKILGLYRAGALEAQTSDEGITVKPKPTASTVPMDNSIKVNPVPTNNHPGLMPVNANTQTSSNHMDIEKVVRKTLKDKNWRARNVIVSGLQEDSSESDSNLFIALCENHLSTKPIIDNHGVRRLGLPSTTRPRRLLVRLCSDLAVSNLLISAKNLRNSSVPYVAANIFINEDLSKEEAKEAFEKRQRKRGLATTSLPTARNEATAGPPTSRIYVNSTHTKYNAPQNRPNLIIYGNHNAPNTIVLTTPNIGTDLPLSIPNQWNGIPLSQNRFSLLNVNSNEFLPLGLGAIPNCTVPLAPNI